MNKFHFDSPKDFLALLVRRKWWVIVPTTFMPMLVLFVALVLPAIYVSQSLILIEPKEVPDDFVKDLISVDSDQRLDAIRETVLSRTNLLRVYREFSERLPELARLNNLARLESLRKGILIEFERPRGRAPIQYFRVSYENRSPETAQQIARRLAELFISYDNKTREEQVFGTAEFLSAELEKAQSKLGRADEALAEFKRNHRYELPDQLDTNLRTLDRLEEERKTNAEALDRFISMRLTVDRQISETPPIISAALAATNSADSSGPASPLVGEYRRKEMVYRDLTARYTDQHPDVRRARAELERLRAEIPAADLLAAIEETNDGLQSRMAPNPVHQKLVAQLLEVRTEIEIRERDKSRIDQQIQIYTRRVANTPQRELQIASLLREFEELRQQHSNLGGKVSATRLAESLESRQKGEQFRILDPASQPSKPIRPNRLLIVLVGFLASLGLGSALAVVREFLDRRFWTHTEVENFYHLPVLAEIPQMLRPRDARRLRYRMLARTGLFAICIAIGASLLVLAYYTPQVREWSTHNLERISLF